MGKPRSRVAEEALEAQQKAAELQKKIRHLSKQIAAPEKHFAPKPDERTQSNAERFRRYFSLDRVGVVEKRKPTRAEMRAQRNRAIVWIMLAFVALIWIIGRLSRMK